MRKFLLLFLLATAALSFTACTPDGEVDANAMKDIAARFQEEVLPTKAEFKEIVEKRIAQLPEEEQAEARADLAKTLREWPTDEEIDQKIDEAINDFAEEMPSRSELETSISEALKDSQYKEKLKEAIDKLPEGEELEKTINQGLGKFFEAMDSVKLELQKEQ